MRSLLVAAAVGCLTAGWNMPVKSEILSMTLGVDGLACPFCAHGLERNLKKVEGVMELKIDIEAGSIDLTFGSTVRLGDGQEPGLVSLARKAVKDGGFTVREVRATVDGIVKGVPGEWRLNVAETGEVIGLKDKGKDTQLQAGSNLVVTGLIVEEIGKMALAIEKIERVAN